MAPKKPSKDAPTVRFEDIEGATTRPRIQIEVLDQAGSTVHVARVADDGTYTIPEGVRRKAHGITLGPAMPGKPTEEEEAAARTVRHTLRASAFLALEERGTIPVARAIWEGWIPRLRCVTGRVRRCRPGRWWFADLERFVAAAPIPAFSGPALSEGPSRTVGDPAPTPSTALSAQRIGRLSPAGSLDELLSWPFRCAPVCDARVEVHRRTCCCRPWIIGDPRIPDLVDRLDGLVPPPGIPVPPDPPFPPIPEPGPLPQPLPGSRRDPGASSFLQRGTLDLARVHAAQDAHAIRSLPAAMVPEYINARPHLRCARYDCSAAQKVAEGELNPDGRYNVCWLDFRGPLDPGCHDRYAFVVRQRFGPLWITIYDGRTANQWYAQGASPTLTTYHPAARTCRRNPGHAFVFLNHVGQTGAWDLRTPAAASASSVAPPGPVDGLVSPNGAIGFNGNRNWGGTLSLNLMIGEGMKELGARYYRVSVATADSAGNPVDGSRHPVDAPVSWFRAESDGSGGVDMVAVTLGPFSVGGQNALYRIPFDSDGDWDDGQFHAYLDTTDARWGDPHARHLVTIEIFDEDGRRLRPEGTPESGLDGPEATAPFTYRRRYQEEGPTAEVPFGALTHLFWWDNREVFGQIVDLRRNGLVFNQECLFLTGAGDSTFGVGYRAFHPNERFQRYHRVSWRRGLGSTPGNTGVLESANPANVGVPPAPPGASGTHTFSQMLRTDLEPDRRKCAFTAFLTVYGKRTNGSNLAFPYENDSAAFVIEIGP